MALCSSRLKKLRITAQQFEHLQRIARGGAFTNTTPEWRLVHLGLMCLYDANGMAYRRPTSHRGRQRQGVIHARLTIAGMAIFGEFCAQG
jgi:hypothetical protein